MSFDSFKDAAMGGRLTIFSIYSELGAHQRIKWTTRAIARLAGAPWRCSSEMWKLDASMNDLMKKMLAHDAAGTDVLILEIGSLQRRSGEVIEWLDSLMPLQANRFGVLIGLLGDEDNQAQELDWTAKELIRCAKKLNRKFIWHWMGHHDMEDSDWLTETVEMLVARKQSATMPVAVVETVVHLA